VAYYFHLCLQGYEAAPDALNTLRAISKSRVKQGLLADGEAFTPVHLARALRQQGKVPPIEELLNAGNTLSFEVGVVKPSHTLYRTCLERFAKMRISPDEILHVGSRLRDDLAIAKEHGMHTALYARETMGLEATAADLKDPSLKPDRLLTELSQLREVLELGYEIP
jgi:FMN phosphatase YigB (HAD superfamily)